MELRYPYISFYRMFQLGYMRVNVDDAESRLNGKGFKCDSIPLVIKTFGHRVDGIDCTRAYVEDITELPLDAFPDPSNLLGL